MFGGARALRRRREIRRLGRLPLLAVLGASTLARGHARARRPFGELLELVGASGRVGLAVRFVLDAELARDRRDVGNASAQQAHRYVLQVVVTLAVADLLLALDHDADARARCLCNQRVGNGREQARSRLDEPDVFLPVRVDRRRDDDVGPALAQLAVAERERPLARPEIEQLLAGAPGRALWRLAVLQLGEQPTGRVEIVYVKNPRPRRPRRDAEVEVVAVAIRPVENRPNVGRCVLYAVRRQRRLAVRLDRHYR